MQNYVNMGRDLPGRSQNDSDIFKYKSMNIYNMYRWCFRLLQLFRNTNERLCDFPGIMRSIDGTDGKRLRHLNYLFWPLEQFTWLVELNWFPKTFAMPRSSCQMGCGCFANYPSLNKTKILALAVSDENCLFNLLHWFKGCIYPFSVTWLVPVKHIKCALQPCVDKERHVCTTL